MICVGSVWHLLLPLLAPQVADLYVSVGPVYWYADGCLCVSAPQAG